MINGVPSYLDSEVLNTFLKILMRCKDLVGRSDRTFEIISAEFDQLWILQIAIENIRYTFLTVL